MSHIQKLVNFVVRICTVFHAVENNRSRLSKDYGSLVPTQKELAHGWIQKEALLVRKATPDDQVAAVAALQLEHEELIERVKANKKGDIYAELELKIWEREYLDPKDKIIAPDFIGIDGHRRHKAFIGAQVLRVTEPEECGVWVDGNPVKGARPVGSLDNCYDEISIEVVPDGTSDKDMLLMQLQRNEKRSGGAKDINKTDRILAGQLMLEKNCIQEDFRANLNVTEGSKVYYFCSIAKRFPSLRLVERATYPAPTKKGEAYPADWINFTALTYSGKDDSLQVLYQRLDSTTLQKLNKKRTNLPKLPILKSAEAGAFFANATKDSKKPNKMNENERAGLIKSTGCDATRITVDAEMKSHAEGQALLEKFVYPSAKIINAAMRMDDAQRAETLEFIKSKGWNVFGDDIPGYNETPEVSNVETTEEADPDLDTPEEVAASAEAKAKPVEAKGRGRVAPAKTK